MTRATEKRHVDPENLILSLTRLRDFLVERDVKELSLPVYDPSRGRLHPRELYALIHVIYSDTNIQVYLQGVQTNRTMQDLDGMKDELEKTRKELDEMTKTRLSTEEDKDMWKRLFEDCNKKQGEEIERLRQDYKERIALATAVEKVILARSVPRGQSPMELLTPREMSQTMKTRLPTTTGRVTIPDPSDTLGEPVVEQTVRKLIETAGRLVTDKNAPGSEVTAPYGTIDDTGRVRLSQSVMTRQGVSDTTPPMGSSKVPERRIRKMPAKKVSRVIDVQKNNQLKYNFTGVPEADLRACFNRATWNPAVNL